MNFNFTFDESSGLGADETLQVTITSEGIIIDAYLAGQIVGTVGMMANEWYANAKETRMRSQAEIEHLLIDTQLHQDDYVEGSGEDTEYLDGKIFALKWVLGA